MVYGAGADLVPGKSHRRRLPVASLQRAQHREHAAEDRESLREHRASETPRRRASRLASSARSVSDITCPPVSKGEETPAVGTGIPLVSLAEAREQALANRKLARAGGDPLADRRRFQGMPTFAEAADRLIEQKRAGWRNASEARHWLNGLTRYAFPSIGTRPVAEVTSADVLAILTPIWHAQAPTAKAVRQRIAAVLEWAVAMEFRSDNPCVLRLITVKRSY